VSQEMLYRVTTEMIEDIVLVREGRVLGTGPDLKWMRGKSWDMCCEWSKLLTLELLPQEQVDAFMERLREIVERRHEV